MLNLSPCCGCDLVLFSLRCCCPTSSLPVFIVLVEVLIIAELQTGINSEVIRHFRLQLNNKQHLNKYNEKSE
jgi:hypothetical protein